MTTQPENPTTTMNDHVKLYLLPQTVNAAVRAGAAVMNIYRNPDDYDISLRDDHTPVTVADRLAHRTIREYLGRTRIPILSEEGREMHYGERRNWDMFWMVNPLDGTAGFIRGEGDFTVDIALMEHNVCRMAVVYAPLTGELYIAGSECGTYLREHVDPDSRASYTYDRIVSGWRRLPLAERARDVQRVAVLRSHRTPQTEEHLDELRRRGDLEVVERGGAYAFCLLAVGEADYHIRMSDTCEWDTAAGELVLAGAGGTTRALHSGGPLEYNKEDLRNPWFVCRSKYCTL